MAALFVTGVVAGWALGYPAGKKSMVRPPLARTQMVEKVADRLAVDLNLDRQQIGLVRPMVEEACSEMASAHGENVQRMCEIMRRTNRKIEPILNENQRALLRQTEAKREASMRKFAPGDYPGQEVHRSKGAPH